MLIGPISSFNWFDFLCKTNKKSVTSSPTLNLCGFCQWLGKIFSIQHPLYPHSNTAQHTQRSIYCFRCIIVVRTKFVAIYFYFFFFIWNDALLFSYLSKCKYYLFTFCIMDWLAAVGVETNRQNKDNIRYLNERMNNAYNRVCMCVYVCKSAKNPKLKTITIVM